MQKDFTSEEIKNAGFKFVFKEQNGFESRYQSWGNCHTFFAKLKGRQYDKLSPEEKELARLHLSFYLASWGMYRGSSFVLQYSNTIFDDVIRVLLQSKYTKLWDLNLESLRQNKQEVIQLLIDIRDSLNSELIEYKSFTDTKNEDVPHPIEDNAVHQTLITKILLGTLCCTPAFDRYFTLSAPTTCNDFYKNQKLTSLVEFIINNSVFEELANDKMLGNYPLMKIVDMAYFNLGIENEFKECYYKYIDTNQPPTSDTEWKTFSKLLRQFYYRINRGADIDIHASFSDEKIKNKIISFLDNYKDKIKL